MEETLQKKGVELTQQTILDYFQTLDPKYIAEDAVYRNLSTGEVYTGREEISGMLHFMYHVAFDAKGEIVNTVITEDKAVVEAYFKGRHTGEIAGLKATNKEVDVPLCVSYDLKDGLIKQARIYLLTDVLMNQLGTGSGSSKQKTTFLVRDIFQLKFGHFRPVKELFDEMKEKNVMPGAKFSRVLTDFTGDAYRLIMENGFDSLMEYETSLSGMADPEWQVWYKKFMDHVESSYREILKELF